MRRLVTAHYHEQACRYLGEFKLREDDATEQFVLAHLVKAGQFDRAMTEAKRVIPDFAAPGGAGVGSAWQAWSADALIRTMIERGNISTALKHINAMKCADRYDVRALVGHLLVLRLRALGIIPLNCVMPCRGLVWI